MLHSMSVPAAFDPRHALSGTMRAPGPAGNRTQVEERTRARLLADYLQGWAEADPVRIAEATAPGYRFDDPFVGTFSTLELPRYFAARKSRAALGAFAGRKHLSFLLRGPMDAASGDGEWQFWREAPLLGLAGTSLIAVGPHGVTCERVAYDLNMALEQLRAPMHVAA